MIFSSRALGGYLAVLFILSLAGFFAGYKQCRMDMQDAVQRQDQRIERMNVLMDSLYTECDANRACWLSLMPRRGRK